mgnify:CR=1 FL=1
MKIFKSKEEPVVSTEESLIPYKYQEDRILKELKDWTEYELPDYLLGKIWKGKYRGQKQKWFIMKFTGNEDEINIKTQNPEFLEWKWISPSKLTETVVHFKYDVYSKIKQELISLNLI